MRKIMKKKRVIGTTAAAINEEEKKLGESLPSDFVDWLLANNGLSIEGVHIYPIRDERDVRKTWESISYNLENGWAQWLQNFEDEEIDFENLLPFGDFGTGDYYCFDYSQPSKEKPIIVHWSHETGETEFRANSFSEFKQKIEAEEFEYD